MLPPAISIFLSFRGACPELHLQALIICNFDFGAGSQLFSPAAFVYICIVKPSAGSEKGQNLPITRTFGAVKSREVGQKSCPSWAADPPALSGSPKLFPIVNEKIKKFCYCGDFSEGEIKPVPAGIGFDGSLTGRFG
jgi:hypothetical protein